MYYLGASFFASAGNMAQHRFTDRWLQSPSLTPPSGRAEYVDGLCPGLHLRVTVMGTRTFSAMYRVNGQLRRKTIGKYPVVTLAAARLTALKLMRDAQDKENARERRARVYESFSYEELVDAYVKRHLKPNARSWKNIERALRSNLSRFNDRLETTLLLGLEEAVTPQNKAADSTLKDLITRSTLRLEGKFFSVWDAPNHLRIIVTSNNERVVRADASERRYAVFEVTSPHQYDPRGRRAFFGRIVEQMETGGYEAILGELLNRDIATFNREMIPETEALRRQKLLNLSNDPVRYYLYERLTDGINITVKGADMASPIYLWHESETVWVAVADLAEDYRAFTEANGLQYNVRSFQLQLRNYMPDGFESKVRRGREGDTITGSYRAYPIPPLEEARATFEAKTGLKIDRDPVEGKDIGCD